jgi:16S rRNA (cytidine1402-2'-O)-methyltransferase
VNGVPQPPDRPRDAPQAPGRLILVPNSLDLGAQPQDLPALADVLPLGVLRTAAQLQHWVVENAKTARAFLKRVNETVPLAHALQALNIVELPRPAKGNAAPAAPAGMQALLAPARAGYDLGLLSEAGLPGVADPGAALVLQAHAAAIPVITLPGPSSLALAVAASGLNGQSFAFVGYLPTEAAARSTRLRELETGSRQLQQTQVFIETPYRNGALLQALVTTLQPGTWLSVSCGLTLASGFTRTDRVQAWRQRPGTLPGDVPAVFALLAG